MQLAQGQRVLIKKDFAENNPILVDIFPLLKTGEVFIILEVEHLIGGDLTSPIGATKIKHETSGQELDVNDPVAKDMFWAIFVEEDFIKILEDV